MQNNDELIKDIEDAVKTIQKSVEKQRLDPKYESMTEYFNGYQDSCKFILDYLNTKKNKPEV